MPKRLFAVTITVLIPIALFCQQTKPVVDYNKLINVNPALQSAIIDSLNARSHVTAVNFSQVPHSILNDTVKRLFYQHVANVYGTKQLQQLNSNFSLFQGRSRVSEYMTGRLRGFYALKNESSALDIMKAGAYSNSVKQLSASAFYDNSPASMLKAGFGIRFEDQLVVGNIPVNIIYNSLEGTIPDTRGIFGQQLKKFSFDKDAYLQRMNGYVNKAYDLKKYFLQDINLGTAVKSFADKQLSDLQDEMGAITNNPIQAEAFKNLISPDQLIWLDSSQIRQVLLNNHSLQLSAADLENNISDSTNTTAFAARQYMSRIMALKESMAQGLQAKEMLVAQHKTTNEIQHSLNDPSSQQRNIKELLPLNWLQKILLQAKHINIGNIAAGGSKGGAENLFMSGAEGSFLSKNKFLLLGLGSTRMGGDLVNQGFTSSLDPGAYSMQYLQTGKGDINDSHSHVAIVNANTQNKQFRQFDASALKRNIFVGAFSEQINLGEYGNITADISKSNTEFNNAAVGNSYALSSKTAAFTFFNDFWETLAAGLDYNGEVSKLGLTQRVYFNYSGLAYNNPASGSGTRGSIRYGLNVRRTWNKRKIMVGFRTDRQDMKTSATSNNGWHNRQYTFDARLKVKKNVSLTARLGQSTMKNSSKEGTQNSFLNTQINLGSQVSGKLFDKLQTNNLGMGLQQMDLGIAKSLLLNLNMNHSVVINSNVLSFSLFYNKDLKNQAVYGNLFTAETGWSYPLTEKISCNSGINYLDNANVVRQVGIRQSISATVLSRLQASWYVDCRKQLMNTPQNYLFGNFNTQLSLNYQFNR
ncbi:hypothetical protein DVR12_15515 [Chitinophaga silvatica]|uniref:Uncharacterized protein n=1 Tax=Chitinophaga silvatica TaxID=2282649 RepID=A0A3E1Y9F1_9BACT|nr:hypothetical protein [Chitinophaga silvatica]RFS22048.1 hypothetical protein DVR12_15515 [Chitinophaga silvatica]